MSNTADIPKVDFRPFLVGETDRPLSSAPTPEQIETARFIHQFSKEHGFLYLENVLDKDLVKAAFDASKQLFDKEDKSSLTRINPKTNTGYAPFQSENINRKRSPDLKEAFNVRFHNNDYTGCPDTFQQTIERLQSELRFLADRFAVACATALGMPLDFFSKTLQNYDLCTLRLLHYPPCDFEPATPSSAIRIGEHTDFGAYTFLVLDTAGPAGLQIQPVSGGEVDSDRNQDQWQTVSLPDHEIGSVIVNTGALMARWTNDVWRATAHRVIVDEVLAPQHRYSMAFFVDPDADSMVEVHPKFTQEGLTTYQPIKSIDYLQMKLKEMMQSTD